VGDADGKIDGGKLHYLYDKLKESPEYPKAVCRQKTR
jgi:hypothetical protein